MIEVEVKNEKGESVERLRLGREPFGQTVHLRNLRNAVVMYEANRRVGTADTLDRGEVAGSGRKIYRQKGTGRARHGDRQAPQFKGGGVAHGPHPRDHSYQIPRKARRLATRNALLSKLLDGEVVAIDALDFPEPKTGRMAGMLRALGISGTSTLVVDVMPSDGLIKSARNLPGVSVRPVAEIHAWEVLRHHRLLITRAAVDALVKSWKRALGRPASAAGR